MTPISLVGRVPVVIAAGVNSEVTSLAKLLSLSKAKPASINYGSPGNGATPHLAVELFERAAGIKLTHVPYKGGSQAINDTLAGHIQMVAVNALEVQPHVKAGKLLALGIGSDKRHPLLPDLPTLAEAGVGQVNVDMWYGIFAPKGTPPALVAQLNREIQQILASEDAKRAFSTQGMDPATSTPEAFGQLVERDAARWAQLIKARQITAD